MKRTDIIYDKVHSFVKAITSSYDAYKLALEAKFRIEFIRVIEPYYARLISEISTSRSFGEKIAENYLLQYNATNVIDKYRSAVPMEDSEIGHFVKLLENNFIREELRVYSDQLNQLISLNDISQLPERIRELHHNFTNFVLSIAELDSLGVYDPQLFAKTVIADLKDRIAGVKTFVSTGLPHLDEKLVEGFAPGKLTIIAGRPGSGKSIVVTNIFHNLVFGTHSHVLFFNNEMDAETIGMRVLSIMTGIDYRRLMKTPDLLTDNERTLINQAVKRITSEKRFVVYDRSSLSLSDIYVEVRSYLDKNSPKNLIVIIDLINRLVDVRESIRENRAALFEQVAYELKTMARDLGVHIVACAQLRRKSGNHRRSVSNLDALRPTMDEVKNSGGFEEAADLLLLLFRPKLYVPLQDLGKDYLEIHIAKQRQGLIDPLPAFFHIPESLPRLEPSEPTPDYREYTSGEYYSDFASEVEL